MQAAPDAQRNAAGRRLRIVDRLLNRDDGLHYIERIGKRGTQSVAGRLDHPSAMQLHDLREKRVVPRDRVAHPIRRSHIEVLPSMSVKSSVKQLGDTLIRSLPLDPA